MLIASALLVSPELSVGSAGEDKSDIACFSLDENGKRALLEHIEVMREDGANARWQLCGYAAETFHEKVFLSFFYGLRP